MKKTRHKVRRQGKDLLFDIVLYSICAVMLLLVIYPLWFIVIASFSDPSAVAGGHVWILPVGFTLEGYDELFKQAEVWTGYKNTIIYTVLGTIFGLVVNIPAAYALSRKDLVGRNVMMMMVTFTMIFNGGLIPTYLLVLQLKLYNTMWALILPVAVSAWNLIVARTFFQQTIPDELLEAATLGGCSNIQFFTRVILGKFAVETMIPVYVAVMMLLGQTNAILLLFVIALLIAQVIMVVMTRNHSLLHDLMAGTVVVDYASQKIFQSTEDLIAYQKKIAAERAARQGY